jgi:hypothetical protein
MRPKTPAIKHLADPLTKLEEDRTVLDADGDPTGTTAYRPSAHIGPSTIAQKLSLMDSFRRDTKNMISANNLAALVECKKQQLQKNIKPKTPAIKHLTDPLTKLELRWFTLEMHAKLRNRRNRKRRRQVLASEDDENTE